MRVYLAVFNDMPTRRCTDLVKSEADQMYGIPNAADFSFLIGKALQQVRIGLYHATLCFDGDLTFDMIACEFEHWPVLKATGTVECFERRAAGLVSLLGASVVGCEVDSRTTLVLRFSNMETLRITEVNQPYLSFTVSAPGGDIVV